MINYKNGDIFKSEVNIICHQVNCKGVMGKGIALTIKTLYPKIFEGYYELCKSQSPDILLGKVHYYHADDGLIIANLFAQDNYNKSCYRGIRQTNYDALRSCFKNILNEYKNTNIVIGIPYKIGCNNGGGDWNIVQSIIRGVFEYEPINIEIYKYDKSIIKTN